MTRTLRLLRRLGAGRRASKALFRGAGYLSRVKTLHRMYDWKGSDEPAEFAGWRWSACNPSMRLLGLSMQLDWDHWDHWACRHDDCGGLPCSECGGVACPHDDDLDEATP